MACAFDGAIADLAPKTLGLLTQDQLDALGVSRQQRRGLVARGVLDPMGAGVWRHAAHPTSWRQRVLAAVLAAGEGAVASHLAAAVLWRFDGVDPGVLDVTVPRGRRPRTVRARVHSSNRLGPADISRRDGIPCTSAACTLLDIAAVLDTRRLEAAIDGAERDGTVWRPQLRWFLGRQRQPGRARPPARPGRRRGPARSHRGPPTRRHLAGAGGDPHPRRRRPARPSRQVRRVGHGGAAIEGRPLVGRGATRRRAGRPRQPRHPAASARPTTNGPPVSGCRAGGSSSSPTRTWSNARSTSSP